MRVAPSWSAKRRQQKRFHSTNFLSEWGPRSLRRRVISPTSFHSTNFLSEWGAYLIEGLLCLYSTPPDLRGSIFVVKIFTKLYQITKNRCLKLLPKAASEGVKDRMRVSAVAWPLQVLILQTKWISLTNQSFINWPFHFNFFRTSSLLLRRLRAGVFVSKSARLHRPHS